MSGPASPKQPTNTHADIYRPGNGNPDEIDVRAFLAPSQAEGELGRLERYRVLKELGRGGMGMVLLAEDSQLCRMAAIKIMLPAFAEDPQARERFLREARAAAKLNHDNIVTIFQVDEANGIPFIAMEFLKGKPLDQFLKDKGEVSIGQAVRIGREIALGLQAAHAGGLIHRDIKPANIWIEAPKGRVRILDFGLARDERDDAHLTQSGAIVGTPAYMSPEQGQGKPLDARSDLFSLGVVLYRLCSGRQPFTGPNMMAVLTSLAVDTPTPVRELNANVPVSLEQIINELLAKDREQRPASAKKVAEALAVVQKEMSGGMPEVVYVVPAATSVVVDPFANIDATSSETTVKNPATKKSTLAVGERSSTRPEQRKLVNERSKRWLALTLGAIVLLAGGIFVVNKMTKNSSRTESKGTETPKTTDESKPVLAAKPPALLKAPFTESQAEKARAEWAAFLKVPERKQFDLPKGVKLELVLIPPGQFRMGRYGERGDEVPHQVTITKPFYMAVTETTQEHYEALTGKNPSAFSAADSSDLPVDQVSWFAAEAFSKAIEARLPTEAQWEYACRAGTTTDFHFGKSLNGTEANCDGNNPLGTNEKGPYLQCTTKVASYPPNAFGLYDMHGNVWEWCRDWYAQKTDDLGEKDPERTVKQSNDRRVLRGGSWGNYAIGCRAAYSYGDAPDGRDGSVGFRVVVVLP